MSVKRDNRHQNCVFKDKFLKNKVEGSQQTFESQSLYLWPKAYFIQISNLILNTGIKGIKKYKLTHNVKFSTFYVISNLSYTVWDTFFV